MKMYRIILGDKSSWTKKLRIMKLTVILLLGSMLAVNAATYSQNTKLTVSSKDASLIDIFRNIEDQSEFYFYFNKAEVKSKENVSVEMKDALITEILDQVLTNTGLEYKIIDRYVVIKEKGAADPAIAIQAIRKISGKVTDSSGATLPGVSVVVKGTTTGTITDAEGNYILGNVPANATVVFSFVGMKSKGVTVGEKTNLNIVLEEESIGLQEVVAIGYGSVKKVDMTGAIASVKGETISKRETTQLSSALQGATSGVMVTRSNGAPGAGATIRIRGITTIGTNDPLIIVDGIPVGGMDDVNAKDVESMSVLKDAAAASIYGSRAAAGVILITTKRGKSGASNINYNYEYGIEQATQMPTYTNAVKYMQYANEQKWNDNNNVGSIYPVFAQDYITNYPANHISNPDLYPDTDWNAMIWKKNAIRKSHSLTFNSGTKNLQTNASFTLSDVGGLYELQSYKRMTARVNNDVTINKYLSATIDLSIKRVESSSPTVEVNANSQKPGPIYAALWADGRVAAGKAGDNRYGQLVYGGNKRGWNNQLSGKISLDLKPFDGLKLSAIFSPTFNYDKSKNFTKAVPYTNYNDPNTIVGYLGAVTTTSLNEYRNDGYFHTTQFIGNYTKSFGKHNLNLMAGYENYYQTYENLGASRDAYELTNYPYLDAGPLTLRGNSGSAWEYAYRSFFGRAMYNYANKYYFQANIRRDGSSRFDPKYRWGVFPSFSAGWVLSNENFMKNISAISYLKLRASWGALGNERIGNYPYQAAISFGSTPIYMAGVASAATTAAQTQYAIPNISWEKTETSDVGLDINLLSNKLQITGDYYLKTTKDMLLALQIPPSLGFDNPNQNTGKMDTKGWDFEVSWNDKIGEIGYSASVNLSDFKSKMGDLGGTEFIGDQIKVKGSEFNEWYGYKSMGLFQDAADVAASAKLYANSKPGDIKYQDISGPKGVPDGLISAQYDRVRLGGSLPRYMYGGNIQLDYKNFDFGVIFQGVGKQNARVFATAVRPLTIAWSAVPTIIEGKFWSNNNTAEQNLAAVYPRLSETAANANNYVMSDFWMFDGSYFRVKNITLGYSIPSFLTEKVKLQSVRFYSTISDAFCYSHYPKGWDPEVSESGYPITMTFIFGVSVKF
jgi:TonB-linked SusC/RagA family outer membrane protein